MIAETHKGEDLPHKKLLRAFDKYTHFGVSSMTMICRCNEYCTSTGRSCGDFTDELRQSQTELKQSSKKPVGTEVHTTHVWVSWIGCLAFSTRVCGGHCIRRVDLVRDRERHG